MCGGCLAGSGGELVWMCGRLGGVARLTRELNLSVRTISIFFQCDFSLNLAQGFTRRTDSAFLHVNQTRAQVFHEFGLRLSQLVLFRLGCGGGRRGYGIHEAVLSRLVRQLP